MKKLQVLNNQKGLTLIEVLAVIVIIGIVAAIAVPNIANLIDRSERNADAQTEKIIADAALLYLINEDHNITGSGSITVKELYDKGYLTNSRYVSQVDNKTYSIVNVRYDNGWRVDGVVKAAAVP